MIQVINFYARSFDLDHMDLFWETEDFFGNILQYDFYIYKSESSSGPWERIAGPFQDQYYFRDTSTPQRGRWRTFFYLLKIIDKTTEEEKSFGPTSQQGEPDLIAMEINRQEDLLLREFVGRRAWVFPLRTFGARCVCYDRVTSRRTKGDCLNCYGTGFLGGFLRPIECFIQFDPSARATSPTPYGELEPNQTTARLISFPQLKPKDIIVEAENHRWRVDRVSNTERLRSVVHQEPLLVKISKGDVEYRLPVNISDLKKLQISSERNFTLPQHVDETELDDLLAPYEHRPRGTIR